MQLILGFFPFSVPTLDAQSIAMSASERHAENAVVGRRNPRQHIGPGEETISLEGVLHPEITGGPLNLELVKAMMATGAPWILISGTGLVWGFYEIDSVEQTRTIFERNGAARKIEFTISLTRVDSPIGGLLGSLLDFMPMAMGVGGALSKL